MSNIENIVRQAISTFAKPQTLAKFQENLNSLAINADKLTLEDVGLNRESITRYNYGDEKPYPVIYVPVFENRSVLVSIFILKPNSAIPLHDHPVMHGVLKVLYGSVHVQSYSLHADKIRQTPDHKSRVPNDFYTLEDSLYEDPIMVKKNASVILDERSKCAVLTPTENNLHEVQSHGGSSAFIDILAPPYGTLICDNGVRRCFYFKERKCDGEKCELSLMTTPPKYWTTETAYRGPKIPDMEDDDD